MQKPKRILFLYTELAGYFMACVKNLAEISGAEIHIVRWPLNAEAPFNFDLTQLSVRVYDRKNYSDQQLFELVDSIQPDLIYCSGWIDKGYLAVCSKWKGKINVVAGLDTPWDGSWKQRLRVITSGFTVRRYFTHLWVAGKPQIPFAEKLGFKNEFLLQGVYAADVNHFNTLYEQTIGSKQSKFPKRFVFAGRYLEFKGIFDLWEAFKQTFAVQEHDWELWCLGTGALYDQRVNHERIKHLGFVQPNEMKTVFEQTGVFILPSRFEPWAVALQEFAIAGYPLIVSNKVGAATAFLEEGKNGIRFDAGNVEQLKNAMLHYIRMSDTDLFNQAQLSHQLGQKPDSLAWSQTLIRLV